MDTETLHKLHQKEVEILKKLIKVCDKLEIKYFAVYGTALGAMRHKGFIPWDDDIDIGMLRKDFEKFIKEAPKLLPPNLFIQCRYTDNNYNINHAKLKDSNTTFLEPGWETRKGNQGVFVDIFPWDYFPTKGLKAKIFKLKKKFYQNIISLNQTNGYWKKTGLKNKIKALLVPFVNVLYPDRHKVAEKLDKIIQELPILPQMGSHGSATASYPSEWFNNVKCVPFEDIMINVPHKAHEYLTVCYGDYMKLPPKEQQVPRHFGGIIDTERPYTYYTAPPLD